jgi:hypothetical protein
VTPRPGDVLLGPQLQQEVDFLGVQGVVVLELVAEQGERFEAVVLTEGEHVQSGLVAEDGVADRVGESLPSGDLLTGVRSSVRRRQPPPSR